MKKFEEALEILIATENQTFFRDSTIDGFYKYYYYYKRAEIHIRGFQDTISGCEDVEKALNFGSVDEYVISICD